MYSSKSCPNNDRKSERGQLVFEYVLLLTVVAVFAMLVVRTFIGQGGTTGTQGLIVQKWTSVINAISSDVIDN